MDCQFILSVELPSSLSSATILLLHFVFNSGHHNYIPTPIVFEIVNKITGPNTVVISLLDHMVICFCFVLRYRRVRMYLHRACKVVVVFFALRLRIVYHL